ncbi:MAG: LamG domain-containing protein, partial [Prevotellaceae bacterium]|nr:LamG domain-containing protein [Prevotellaceae bacterium]
MKLNGFNNRNRRICESSEGRRRTDATYCVSGAGVVGAGVVDKRSDKRKGGVDKRGSDNHIADKRTDATCCVSTSGVSTSGVSSKCGADNHIVDKRTDAIFCVSTSGVSTSGVSTGVSALSLMKIFVMACMLVLSVNVFAKDFGGAFTADNLLRDVTWNEEKGRIEFKVMFYDNYGTERSEWIRQAEIYINNTKIGRIFHGCPGENSNGVVQEGWTTPSISPYNDYDYAALCFYSTSSSTTNRLAMYALGSGLACDDYVTSTSNYKEIPVTHDDNRWYTYDLNNRVSIADDPYTENHYYAEFYWYPGVVNVTDLGTVEISLRNIMVVEHISGAWMYPNNVFDEVDVTMPAATGHSMTGGLIGSEGKISFTCKADEATTIELVRSSSGYVPASQTGSNVTFDDKYVTSEDYFLNGRVFTFNSLRSVSDGKTVYVRRSDKSVITQRTGVFSDSLDASLETCGKVKLTWHIKNPSTTSNVNTQGFTLEVKKGDEGWTEISSGVPGYTATTASTSDYSYTYTIPESDRNKGTVNYEFRIKRAFAKWDDTSFFDYVQNVIIFQRNRAVAINTDFKQLTDIEIKPEGIDSYPRLTWNMAADGFECKDNITLKLKVTRVSTGTSTEINIPKDSIDKGGYHTSSVNGVENCVPQRYELILQYGSLPAITYIVSNSYLYQRTGKREFESIIVSKGYYADKNNIKWTLKKDYDEFDRFRLMRKEADQSDDGYVIVGEEFAHTRGKLQYETDDRAINAGVYYIYKIDGVHQCSDNIESLSSPVSIGFSQPYGSVSGRVTYTGSQAVKDVEIKVSTDNALNSNRELEFDSALSDSYLSIPAGTKLFNSDGFSFEAWLKFSASQNDTIVSNSLLTVTRGTDNRIRVRMANSATTVTAPATIANGEYAHLTVTVQKLSNYKSYNIKVYIGKTLSVSTNVTNLSADAATPTAATIIGKSFTGYLDDLRVWNTVLDSSAIALNYDRVLGGKESGLAAYYRFDEIDAAESAIFDCSAVGTAFNGNHATKGAEVNRSNVPVSASHLTIKGVTDANGNYSITNSIPYTSEGTIYTLLPSLGIHQFDPNNQPLYFSPDSKVFNNINFTDISSFPVSGQINYAGSSYPVEGVQISIDGLVASKDGGMVETDTEGKFTVDVPIGSHFISVSKHGHVFADGGRFPANSLEKYNFQTSVNGLTFTDNTTVRIMGKVVGGKPQSDKPLGFGLSSANIGQATVRLETVNNVYRLNLVDADSIVDNNEIGGVTSKTTFKHPAAGSEIEIETNPVTGEFLAVLPPVPYTLTYVKTADFTDTFIDGDPWDFEYSKTTFDVNPSSELTAEYVDSTGVKHEFVYHDSLKITRYNEPVIKVRDLGAAEGAFGDSIYVYSNTVLNTSDTVHLYSVNAGTVAYSLGYPVFSDKQGQYDWVITAYEEYRNRDDAANPVTDRVPLEGQEIAISNGLASQEVTFDYNEDTGEVGSQVSLTASESTVTLNENGQQRLRFNTSFPNLGGDHLLAVKMTLNQNGKEIVWNNNQPAG